MEVVRGDLVAGSRRAILSVGSDRGAFHIDSSLSVVACRARLRRATSASCGVYIPAEILLPRWIRDALSSGCVGVRDFGRYWLATRSVSQNIRGSPGNLVG